MKEMRVRGENSKQEERFQEDDVKKGGRRQKGQRGAKEGDDENTRDEKKEQGIQ